MSWFAEREGTGWNQLCLVRAVPEDDALAEGGLADCGSGRGITMTLYLQTWSMNGILFLLWYG